MAGVAHVTGIDEFIKGSGTGVSGGAPRCVRTLESGLQTVLFSFLLVGGVKDH